MKSKLPNTLIQYEEQLRSLVDDHLRLDDDRLGLAVAYMPEGEERDIYLLEVLERLGSAGGGFMHGRDDIVDTEISSTPGFPMEPAQHLHLLLTNPTELHCALEFDWPQAVRYRSAIELGRFVELFTKQEYHHDFIVRLKRLEKIAV